MNECGLCVLFDGVGLRGKMRFKRFLTIVLMRFLQMGMNGVFKILFSSSRLSDFWKLVM